jgi:gliding motility-associated-like protein
MPEIQALIPGRYWVRATNACGTFTDTIRIYTPAELQPALPDDTTICNSIGSAILQVPSAFNSVRWSTGASTHNIRIDTPGLYWVEAQNPCAIFRDTVRVHFCAPVIRSISLSRADICEGDCIQPSASVTQYPQQYEWRFEGGVPDRSTLASPGTVCYPLAGTYAIRLVVRNIGGADSLTEYVVVSAKPARLFKDTVITAPYGSTIGLPACAPAQHADWYIGDSLICRDCPELRIDARYYLNQYRCVVRNGACRDSCSYILRVIDIPHDLWLPDAFTPNGDGRNDIFRIITDNPNVQVVNLDVYNRWGQRVFSSNLNNGGWDGTMNGKPLPAGTYFWQIRYRMLDRPEQAYHQKGDVLLVR